MRALLLLAACVLLADAHAQPAKMTSCEQRYRDRKTELEREMGENVRNLPTDEARRRNTELVRELTALGKDIDKCNEALRNPPQGAPGHEPAQARFRSCQAEANRSDEVLRARYPNLEKDQAAGLAYQDARQVINQRYRECMAAP